MTRLARLHYEELDPSALDLARGFDQAAPLVALTAAQPVYTASLTGSGAGSSRHRFRKRRLMRHNIWSAFLAVSENRLTVDQMEPMDDFVYGHDGYFENLVAALVARGKTCYRYFDMLTIPPAEWSGAPNRWFTWAHENLPRLDIDGVPARFRYFGNRHLIDWVAVTPTMRDEILTQLLSIVDGASSFFLDQWWRKLAPWMFEDTLGPGYDDFAPVYHEARAAAMDRLLGSLMAARPVITNGERLAAEPGPMLSNAYLENADWNWDQDVKRWVTTSRDVLSTDTRSPMARDAAHLWAVWGGRLAYTGDDWFDDQGSYDRALSFLREYHSPV